MKYKRKLMGVAALLIIIFHFWMPLTTSVVEASIYKCTYLGVDIFFLLSAYSLARREELIYGQFIRNRFKNVYLPYVVMAIICAVYKKWSIAQFLRVVSGIEFLNKGGGAFLWFAVAIMLLYIVAPGLLRLKSRFGWRAGVISLVAWLIIVSVLQVGFSYTTIFILLNRIPIFIVGLYYEEIKKLIYALKKWSMPLILAGLVVGSVIVYMYCGNVRISRPIVDIYYVFVIPFTLSLVLLCDYISQQKTISKKGILDFIGSFTLELYGLQMIFGYPLETKLFRVIKGIVSLNLAKLLTFILTACALIILAWLFSKLMKRLEDMI